MSQAPTKAANDEASEGTVGFSCAEEVAQRISRLYGDDRLADIIFVVQLHEDEPIQRFVGHRNIISMWSEVLKGMLRGGCEDGFKQEVLIGDVQPEAFEAMLKLMYCGTAEITFDNVLAILDVSVRFDVAPLVQFCVQFLQNHTSSEHACRMLEVGVQYNLSKLMDKCIELIVTDDHILQSEDFLHLPQSAIIELVKHDSWNLHEDEIYDTMLRWAVVNCGDDEAQDRDSLAATCEALRRELAVQSEQLQVSRNCCEAVPTTTEEAIAQTMELKAQMDKFLALSTNLENALAELEAPAAQAALLEPILEHIRYPHMSVDKLNSLTCSKLVPSQLIFDALFFKLHHSGPDDPQHPTGRYRPRPGSLLFSWVPTSKVTVSGDCRENARHTSSNGFTGVRGDRRMQHGVYSWTVSIAETQSSWIFVGVAQAEDPNDVAWRSTGHMLYCLDSRFFHQGSGQNHPQGDRKIGSGSCIRVTLDCTQHTLAFGINNEKAMVLFQDLSPVAYVPAVDLRDCGDKVRLVNCDSRSSKSSRFDNAASADAADAAESSGVAENRRMSAPAEVSLSGHAGQSSTVAMDESSNDRGMPSRSSVPGEMPARVRPLSNNEVHAALGISHHPAGMGGSNARMSQPRQSQGSQGGGVGAALMMGPNFDRTAGLGGSLAMEPLSMLEEDRETSWEPRGMDLRGDMVPPHLNQ